MKTFAQRVRYFFFPPPGTPFRLRVLPYGVLTGFLLVMFTAGAFTWEYTNSPTFCGTSCHTMPPEYTAYLTSPHARIACVDCHIGKGFIATRITRKAGDLKHVFATAFKSYEFPIRADDLRPARETCELCHFPEKFSDDSLRQIKSFANDRDNTPQLTYLVLKTGGGSRRAGLGRGIHWHIENRIQYLATDLEEQEIPYVRTTNPDGSTTEYIQVGSDIEPGAVDDSKLLEMDCITCHNRITHLVATPEATIDNLLARGIISTDIPEIRRVAVELYGRLYDRVETGLNGISGLEGYYQKIHPEFYAANTEKIRQAVQELQKAYRESVYPEQNSNWFTHPNNIGHKDTPGCFRCHDGKHLDANQQAIRLECNLCHSIPVVVRSNDFVADIEISSGPEPASHLNPSWINLHREAFDDTCMNCHTTELAGGTQNVSFCSNSACHGSSWEFAGFDAPGLRQKIIGQLPPTPTSVPQDSELTFTATIGGIFKNRCTECHGQQGIQGLDLTTYASTMAGSSNGPVIVPGDSEASKMIQILTGGHFAQIERGEIVIIQKWIQAGSPEK